MEKEFINYEQALALKELGFDEPCFRFYDKDYLSMSSLESQGVDWTLVPLFQQAFRWFREQGFEFYIRKYSDNLLNYYQVCLSYKEYEAVFGKSSSYEKAELTCLNKLIEIAQNK